MQFSELWLVALRFVAILGMALTTAVASHLVPHVSFFPIGCVLSGLFLFNLCSLAFFRKFPHQRSIWIDLNIVLDIFSLTIILWFSGGLKNPFAIFILFHIVIAGLLARTRTLFLAMLCSVASCLVLFHASRSWIESISESTLLFGKILSLSAAIVVIGFFVFLYQRHIEELQKKNILHEKLVLLGRMSATIAHEVNTPLATIRMAASDLREISMEKSGSEESKLACTILEECERASDTMSMMQGHLRPDLYLEEFEVVDFVQKSCTAELKRNGFLGKFEFKFDREYRISMIKSALGQILRNVIRNAVQATANAENPTIEILIHEQNHGIILSIQDNGTGIDPKIVDRLCEPFATTHEENGGTGLGLYVCKILAEKINSSFEIHPREKGTEVRMTILNQ